MTAYFDEACTELDGLGNESDMETMDAIRALELRVVFDVSITAQAPEFPAHLRELVHRTVLGRGVYSQPTNMPLEHQADFETLEQHKARLRDLIGDMHDIFHAVARDESCIFGDDPRSWAKNQFYDAQEVRERMAEKLAEALTGGPL